MRLPEATLGALTLSLSGRGSPGAQLSPVAEPEVGQDPSPQVLGCGPATPREPLPDSPLSLAESLHGPEPGPEVLFRCDAVIVAGRLEQLDLGDHFEFLGARGKDGMLTAGACWGAGPGTASGSPLPTLSLKPGSNSPPETILDSTSCTTLLREKLPHRFCIQLSSKMQQEGGRWHQVF